MSIRLASFKIIEKSEKVSSIVDGTKAPLPELGDNNLVLLNSYRVALKYVQEYVDLFGIV